MNIDIDLERVFLSTQIKDSGQVANIAVFPFNKQVNTSVQTPTHF